MAIRTAQYLLTNTLSTSGDHFALFTPALPSEAEMANPHSEHALKATDENIVGMNISLDQMLIFAENGSGNITSNTSAGGLPMWLNVDALSKLLTKNNSHLWCSQVLIVLAEQDIEMELANILTTASEMNPSLRIFFLDVSSATGAPSSDIPVNVKRVLCTTGAVYALSDVSVTRIAHRASNVQSYLNYLSLAGKKGTIVNSEPLK